MAKETMNPTNDLTQFGKIELETAGELLIAYAREQPNFLGDGVQVWFNTSSGNVFLSDEDYNVAMFNNNKLEQFFNCSNCGNEGFADDYEFDKYDGFCSEECLNESR